MKSFVLSLILLAGSAGAALGQAAHGIKLNPFSAGIRTASLFYEHRLGERRSAQLGVALTSMRPDDTHLDGLTLVPEYRFYLSGQALDGFYLAPFARFRTFRMSAPTIKFDDNGRAYTEDRVGRTRTIGGGVVAGWQWLLGRHITLDVYAGPSYNASTFSANDGTPATEYDDYSRIYNIGLRFSRMFDGAGLRSGFTVGFAW